jgi:hypothetical protein
MAGYCLIFKGSCPATFAFISPTHIVMNTWHCKRCGYEVPGILYCKHTRHSIKLYAKLHSHIMYFLLERERERGETTSHVKTMKEREKENNDSWTIGVLGFDSRRGLGIFLFTTASRTALGTTQPLIQWVPGASSLGVKRPGREADYSPPSTAEVNE